MENTAKVLNWGFIELTKVPCDDETANKTADEFISATVEFCETVRKSIDWFELGIVTFNKDGTPLEDSEKAEILDNYLRYTRTDDKLSIWLSDTDIRKVFDEQNVENGIAIPLSADKRAVVSMNPLIDYMNRLGILEEVLALGCYVCYSNIIDVAYFVLADKLEPVLNLRVAVADDHDNDGEICATIKLSYRGMNVQDVEMTEDTAILENNPDKKWYLNVGGVMVGMAFDPDKIKVTQQEYEESVKKYLGEQMLSVFEQHPDGLSILYKMNGVYISSDQLIKGVEKIKDAVKYNMHMMKTDDWQILGADYLPYAELEDGDEITYIAEIVAVSEDMDILRIPLM